MTSRFRESLRLPDFEYLKDGAYFVTIVTQNRACLFGSIVEEEMKLNEAGMMIDQVCREITGIIQGIYLDDYQIMPNHYHGIIVIEYGVGAGLRACPGRTQPQETAGSSGRVVPIEKGVSLPEIVGRFKSLTTHRYIEGVKKNHWEPFDRRLWQRNYFERVIRNEREHQAISDYIFCNPRNWEKDEEYPC